MTIPELKTHLEYRDGGLYWIKPTSNRVKIGDPFGSEQNTGYVGGRIGNRFYLAHRLIYMFAYGPIPKGKVIDHIDRNKLNNNTNNLRLVTSQENTFNCLNTKGYVNVGTKFQARITLNQKQYIIGTYETATMATNAYEHVKPILHTYTKSLPSSHEIKAKILEVRPLTQTNNTSGTEGVHKRPNGTYQARYTQDGRRKSLGHFKTYEEAKAAVLDYKSRLF